MSLFIKKNNLLIKRTGFTMIELLIAMAVFFIGLMAAFSLSLYNLNTSKENVNRVIAANLTREGIELVRNIRDSNWLAREANVTDLSGLLYEWDHGLGRGNFRVDHARDYTADDLEPLGAPNDSLDNAIDESQAILNLNNGFYTHTAGTVTTFRRAMHLQEICLDVTGASPVESILSASGSDTCDSLGQSKIGLRLTARVRYTYGNKTNTIDSVENIYNWRQ